MLITITGNGFDTGATVDVGGSACTGVTVVSVTSITCTAPALGVGARAVTVTVNTVTSGSVTLTYIGEGVLVAGSSSAAFLQG